MIFFIFASITTCFCIPVTLDLIEWAHKTLLQAADVRLCPLVCCRGIDTTKSFPTGEVAFKRYLCCATVHSTGGKVHTAWASLHRKSRPLISTCFAGVNDAAMHSLAVWSKVGVSPPKNHYFHTIFCEGLKTCYLTITWKGSWTCTWRRPFLKKSNCGVQGKLHCTLQLSTLVNFSNSAGDFKKVDKIECTCKARFPPSNDFFFCEEVLCPCKINMTNRTSTVRTIECTQGIRQCSS